MAKKKFNPVHLAWIIPVILVVIIGVILFVFMRGEEGIFDFKFFDKEGNLITTKSKVGSVEGIYSMETTVTATNTGDVPINFSIDTVSSNPENWSKGFTSDCDTSILKDGVPQTCNPAQSQIANSGGSVSWTSALVKTEPFEGDTPTTFTIYVDGEYTIGGVKEKLTKIESEDVLIEPDEEPNGESCVKATTCPDKCEGANKVWDGQFDFFIGRCVYDGSIRHSSCVDCGDGICNEYWEQDWCCMDCGCPDNKTCVDNLCDPPEFLGWICPNKCDGDYKLYNGQCNLSEKCDYDKMLCSEGCKDGKCIREPCVGECCDEIKVIDYLLDRTGFTCYEGNQDDVRTEIINLETPTKKIDLRYVYNFDDPPTCDNIPTTEHKIILYCLDDTEEQIYYTSFDSNHIGFDCETIPELFGPWTINCVGTHIIDFSEPCSKIKIESNVHRNYLIYLKGDIYAKLYACII